MWLNLVLILCIASSQVTAHYSTIDIDEEVFIKTINDISDNFDESYKTQSKAIDESIRNVKKLFIFSNPKDIDMKSVIKSFEDQRMEPPPHNRPKRQVVKVALCIALAAEVATTQSSLNLAKARVAALTTRIAAAEASLASTTSGPLRSIWSLLLNIQKSILKVTQSSVTALEALLARLQARQVALGCVTTTTTTPTTTTTTTTPTTTTTTTTPTTTTTTPTTTTTTPTTTTTTPTTTTTTPTTTTTTPTTTTSEPCGIFVDYNPSTDPTLPETLGFSGTSLLAYDGTLPYVGIGQSSDCPGEPSMPGRISTQNTSSGPGVYMSCGSYSYDGVTAKYLKKHPDLTWTYVTSSTFELAPNKVTYSSAGNVYNFGVVVYTLDGGSVYIEASKVQNGAIIFMAQGVLQFSLTSFFVLTCDPPPTTTTTTTTTTQEPTTTTTTTQEPTTTTTPEPTTTTTSTTTQEPTTTTTQEPTTTTTVTTTTTPAPATCSACGPLGSCIIGSPSDCVCSGTKVKTNCFVGLLGFCCK